jgi:putative flippase GtrA
MGLISDRALIARFLINGLVATAIHYGVLHFNLQVLGLRSAGLSNLCAAVFGIAASFFGNRYFVFAATRGGFGGQAAKFVLVYAALACLHGMFLFLWTDIGGHDYRLGFLLATGLQVALSFSLNRMVVFKHE